MSVYEDEIDLRPYVFALRKKWWLIALVTILVGAGAFVYSILQPSKYEATATILLTRTRAALALAEQFPTINDPIDSRSRLDAMQAIAKSDDLLVETKKDLNDQVPGNGIERRKLKTAVDVTSNGDTIKIIASNEDPEIAELIANTWAQNAVTAINYAYSGEQLPGEIQAGLKPAQQEYEAAQLELETFLMDNKVDVLQKQIDQDSTLLDELVQDRTWQIAYNVRRKQKMEQVIDQGKALKEQLSSSANTTAASLGYALAVMRLHTDAFGEIKIDRDLFSSQSTELSEGLSQQETLILTSEQPDLVYNVQLSQLVENLETGQSYERDLERIIQHAESEKEQAENNLIDLAEQTLDIKDNEILTATSNRLRILQSELEKEQARLNELSSQRDLSWQAYQALAQKETEVRNNLLTSNTVTLASPAVAPDEPASRGVLINTAIGGALGFFLSVLLVVAVEWWRLFNEPGIPAENAS
jgi:uncharacterized protein involved in exopolysaccharide biosynthesis